MLSLQLQDDILDLTGDEEEIGKPVGSDEKNHKTTYVTLKGLERSQRDVEDISSLPTGFPISSSSPEDPE